MRRAWPGTPAYSRAGSGQLKRHTSSSGIDAEPDGEADPDADGARAGRESQPVGGARSRSTQKLSAANISGTRVSLSPRSAPAAMVCTPSTMKKVEPSASKVAASATVAPASASSTPRNRSGMTWRSATITSAIVAMKAAPRPIAAKPARRVPAASLPSDGMTDTHGRRHRDAERHHEQDRGDLQRDLMRGERGGADPAHQDGGDGEQAVFEQERAGDRRADHDQPAEQRPVDAPEAAEHAEFAERPLRIGDPEAGHAHADVDDRRGDAGAEQVELRQAELAVDQRIGEQRIGRDRGERDPERRLRPVDRAHEAAQRDEPPGRHQAPAEPDADSGRRAARCSSFWPSARSSLRRRTARPSSARRASRRPTGRRASARRTMRGSRAPKACAASGATADTRPMPTTKAANSTVCASAAPAIASSPRWPMSDEVAGHHRHLAELRQRDRQSELDRGDELGAPKSTRRRGCARRR